MACDHCAKLERVLKSFDALAARFEAVLDAFEDAPEPVDRLRDLEGFREVDDGGCFELDCNCLACRQRRRD